MKRFKSIPDLVRAAESGVIRSRDEIYVPASVLGWASEGERLALQHAALRAGARVHQHPHLDRLTVVSSSELEREATQPRGRRAR